MAKSVDTKDYREYLEKEMSIMGILSAFSVLAAGGVMSGVMASNKGPANDLWNAESMFITSGAALCVLASSFFYKQRSNLAWYYGRICLAEALNSRDDATIRELLKEVDYWSTWWPYSVAFTSLISGFIGFGLSLIFFLILDPSICIKSHGRTEIEKVVLCAGLSLSLVIAGLQFSVLNRYKDADRYWIACFWRDFPNFWRRPQPHA